MDEFFEIGKKLKQHKDFHNQLRYLASQGYNDQTCDKLIKICLQANVNCQPLVNILRSDNQKECNAILLAAIGD